MTVLWAKLRRAVYWLLMPVALFWAGVLMLLGAYEPEDWER